MNILAVCHFGLYEELSSSFVHNQIREYAAQGHRIRCIVPIPLGKRGRTGSKFGPAVAKTTVDGVEIVDVRYISTSGRGRKSFNHNSAIAAIRLNAGKIFEDFTPDIIHAHTLGLDSRIGAWLKTKFSCPLVVTTHGSDTVRPLKSGEGHILKADCQPCDALTAVSGPLKEKLASCGTATPIEVIHNGFIPREVTGAERDEFGIIQVGHLIESKHFDTTIRSLARLKDRYPKLHLTVVGQGHLRESLQALAAELGVADRVEFTGAIPNEEVFRRMCQNRFFVMVSKPEGFGIVYLEAMAAGCLTVGTEGQGIADILKSGENGFLAEAENDAQVADILAEMLENPEKCEKIAKNGQALARSMTWAEASRKYIQLFNTLIQK